MRFLPFDSRGKEKMLVLPSSMWRYRSRPQLLVRQCILQRARKSRLIEAAGGDWRYWAVAQAPLSALAGKFPHSPCQKGQAASEGPLWIALGTRETIFMLCEVCFEHSQGHCSNWSFQESYKPSVTTRHDATRTARPLFAGPSLICHRPNL